MNFVQLDFWKLFICFIGIIFLTRIFVTSNRARHLFDPWLLAAASLLFFGLESWLSLGILLAAFLMAALACNGISRAQGRRGRIAICMLAVPVLLLPLAYYKYGNFLSGDRLGNLLLPVGISFYSFQLIGAVVDTYRQPEKKSTLLNFLNFTSFFPQIVAGPIERKSDLLPQIEKFSFKWDGAQVESGLRWLALGFIYKLLIADNLGTSSGWISKDIANPYLIHLANVCFGLRIYFDFAGYSFIALGLAHLLGIRLTENFRSPYLCTSIREFWRSWHRTLTNWFRDYIYIPLGGARSRYRGALVLLVFGVSGLWHGAGWNFIAWGLFHGILVFGHMLLEDRIRMPKCLARLVTLALVATSWLFFYETDMTLLSAKVQTLLNPVAYAASPLTGFASVIGSYGELIYLLASLLVGFVAIFGEALSVRKGGRAYCVSRSTPMISIGIFAAILFAPVTQSGFIYFNF